MGLKPSICNKPSVPGGITSIFVEFVTICMKLAGILDLLWMTS